MESFHKEKRRDDELRPVPAWHTFSIMDVLLTLTVQHLALLQCPIQPK